VSVDWTVMQVAIWVVAVTVGMAALCALRSGYIAYRLIRVVVPEMRPPPSSLRAGDLLPDIRLESVTGASRSSSDLRGKRQAITVVNPECAAARTYLSGVPDGERQIDPMDPTVRTRVVVCVGALARAAEWFDMKDLQRTGSVYGDPDRAAIVRWGVNVTPLTIVVDEELRVVRHVLPQGKFCDEADVSRLIPVGTMEVH
jgi:hypothetical protein